MKNVNDYYQNKLALITGGSSGIGLALGQQLSAKGANICILARRQKQLLEAKQAILETRKTTVQTVDIISADASDKDQIFNKLNSWMSDHGVPDILINSAGVAHPGHFNELDLDIFRWTMEVNYFGTIYPTKCIASQMSKRGSGHIINLSSMAGFLGVYGYTAYSASKFAVRGFSDALRYELKPLGIKVSIVFPPDTDTPQLKYENQFKPAVTKEIAGNAGMMKPEDVAGIILKEAARGKYIITPGLESFLFFRISNLLGTLLYPFMDILVSRAIKKINTLPKGKNNQ